jgi:hypothetical protein
MNLLMYQLLHLSAGAIDGWENVILLHQTSKARTIASRLFEELLPLLMAVLS